MISYVVISNRSDDNVGIESIKSKNRNYRKWTRSMILKTVDTHNSIETELDVDDRVEVLRFSSLPSSDIIIIINASGTVTRTNQTNPS